MSTPLVDADPSVPRWRLPRDRYEAMVAAGLLDGQPVELLEGVLVEVSPMSGRHARAVALLTEALGDLLGREVVVASQVPLAVSDLSEPEPDVAVVDRTAWDAGGHPSTAHLVVEVAGSSLSTDLQHKPRLYAGAGVPRYWVLDLRAAEVVVHSDPAPDVAGAPGYRTVRRLGLDAGLEVLGCEVRLSDVL